MSIYRLILYIGFLMIYGLCKAENPLYTVIGKAQGLPSHEIYDIYQDKKGFMWFATEEGLCRYDGFSTKRFVAPRQGHLSGTYIQEDRYGRIWYITFEGFAYYTSGDSLYKLQEPISSNPLWYSFAIIEDNILLLRENGVHIYDITTLQIKKEVFLNTKNLLTPFRSDSHFMISTTDTIYQINKNGAIRKQPFAALTLSAYKDSTLYSFGRGNSLTYSILTPNLESRSGNIKGGGFLSNLEKCNDELWLCTTNGVYRGIPEVDSFSQKFFEGKSINCVFLDREGNYWFGIGNEGVFLVNDLHTSIFLPTIEGNTVTINDNNIVIGNTNGEIILLKPDMTIEKTVFKTGTKHKIRSILIGEKYNFILSDKLYATDTNWKAIGGNTLAIKSLIPIDHKYYAFAGTGRIGLFRLLNPNHEMIKSEWDNVFNLNYSDAYSHNGLLLSFFNQEYLRGTSVAYDSIHKIIYFNTSNGIKTFSPSDAGEFKYQNNRITAISLVFHGRSTCILLNTGELLQTHDGKTAQQLSFSHQNITIKPKSIKLIGDYLYLITETGLYRTPSRNLNAQNNPFSIGCSLVMNAPDYDNEILDFTVRQNKLYILALKGVVVKTLLESEPTYNPKFSIDKIINNSKYHSTDAELCFSYNENDIRVDYNILSFMTKGEFPLYYRINKGEWKQTEKNSRSLLLTMLSPGEYTMEFWFGSEFPIEKQILRFTILKPWWQSYWFHIIIASFILFTFIAIHKLKTHVNKKQTELKLQALELERELYNSKLTSIRSQMNPHFFYNALNTIQAFIFANERKNAVMFLSKFAKLTRMILEMSENESILLSEELQAISMYLELEKSRFEESFQYEIQVSENLNPDLLKIPTMILQPYIENAIKHGLLHKTGIKKLMIIFSELENGVKITIEDNGIGRKRSTVLNQIKKDKPNSFATNANEKRIALLNSLGAFHIEVNFTDKMGINEEPAGTIVEILVKSSITPKKLTVFKRLT